MGSLIRLYNAGREAIVSRVFSAVSLQINRSITGKQPKLKKRPASPFASYFRQNQQHLKKENPYLSQPELMKKASEKWNNKEDSTTKQLFQMEFEQKMKEYKEEIKLPKRPASPYMKFFQENNKGLQYICPDLIERAKRVGAMWQELSEIEKGRYRSQYGKELQDYNDNLSEEDKKMLQQRRLSLQKHRERKEIRRFGREALKERPKAPLNSAFKLFIRENSGTIPEGQNTFKYLSVKWKILSEQEKSLYKQRISSQNEKYEKDLSEWEKKHDRKVR